MASTVGLICLNIFGCRHPGGRDYAMHLGLALQLTNITRDVATDLARGRIYLPQDEMARTGCTEATLRAGRVTPEVAALLALQCARARHYYDLAAAALPPGEARHLVAAEIMGAIYFGHPPAHRGPRLRRVHRSGAGAEAAAGADCRLHVGPHAHAGGGRGGGAGTHLVIAADVVVVGAGCAGLSAATALSEAGATVLVVEARPVLGGRTFATRDQASGDWVDNGQHVLLGCYHETLAFARRIGAERLLSTQTALSVPMVDRAGRMSELRCPALPTPMHLVGGVLGWSALSWRERLSVVGLARALRGSAPPPVRQTGTRVAGTARPGAATVRASVGAAGRRRPQSTDRHRHGDDLRGGRASHARSGG